MTEAERRTTRRIDMQLPVVSMQVESIGFLGAGKTQNVSAGGMLARFPAQGGLEPGQGVKFEIRYESQAQYLPGSCRITGQGRIVRVGSSPGGTSRLAVEFSDRLLFDF